MGKKRANSVTFSTNKEIIYDAWSLGDKKSEREFDENGDGKFENGVFIKNHGLNWFITGLFVVGDLAGGGLVALPTAMIQLGFGVGIVANILMNIVVMITAYMLGVSWNVLVRRWPEYRSHCRKPYPEIAYRALGHRWRLAVSICIDVTQFGIAVVYLLLSSKNIHDAIKSFTDKEISFCYVILVVAACLTPVLFLKSPQDFWWAVVLAMFTTSAAVVLILLGSSLDYDVCHKVQHEPKFRITNYFLGLGTLLFSYGGHSAFPTIQHDMKKPSDFTKSSIMAFIILFFMYTPVCIIGYLTYGDSLRDSVINSLQISWIQQAVNLLITIHCILTLTIVFNPLNQEVEELLKVPQEFSIKRVFVRSGMMVAVVIVAESVPNFGPLLDLMGGSTLTLTSIIFPSLFYLYLSAGETKAERLKLRGEKEEEFKPLTMREMYDETPKWVVALAAVIIAFGIFGGAAATFSAIDELSTTHFTYPCYVTPFIKDGDKANGGQSTNCCGFSQEVIAHPSHNITCSDPAYDFYGSR